MRGHQPPNDSCHQSRQSHYPRRGAGAVSCGGKEEVRIVKSDQPALDNEQSPVVHAGWQREQKRKGKEDCGNAKASPDTQEITVHFIFLVNQRV